MKFYELSIDVESRYLTRFSPMKPVHLGSALLCSECGLNFTDLPWLPPRRAEIDAHGRALGDVAYFGDDLLVSDRFRSAWQEAGLRGIESFDPLERLRIRPARLSRNGATYFYVAPHHFGTQIDIARSVIDYDEPYTCEKCKSGSIGSIRGFTIDEASWTGEDIFIAWGILGSIIVTDRVRQLRDDYGLTNVNLTPVEEFWWDPYSRWTVCDYSPPDGVVYEYCTEEEAKSNLERALKTR